VDDAGCAVPPTGPEKNGAPGKEPAYLPQKRKRPRQRPFSCLEQMESLSPERQIERLRRSPRGGAGFAGNGGFSMRPDKGRITWKAKKTKTYEQKNHKI
jgi:hypothetical protein